MMRFPIVIHKDKASDYGVMIPDLPGCYSAGNTYQEALDNAKEAIECHLGGLLLDNEILPIPTTMDQHITNPEYQDGVWAFVEIDLTQISGKSVPVNITFHEKHS